MSIIRTDGLTYSYHDGWKALKGVDFELKKGCITAIMGGNGAGKSTFFLTLNGINVPTSGNFYYDEALIKFDTKGINFLRKNVGILFQDPNDQIVSGDVRSDIAFGLLNMGLSSREALILVEDVCDSLGINDLLSRSLYSLSYGQKKKVALAGILVMKPEVIVLDEPTSGLDPKGIKDLFTILRLLVDNGTTILLSTHDVDLVPLYCDYAYIMHDGVMIKKGLASEIFDEPAKLDAANIDTPHIARLATLLRNIGVKIPDYTVTVDKMAVAIKDIIDKV